MELESAPGEGSQFSFTACFEIPEQEPFPSRPAIEGTGEERVSIAGLRILLAEDHPVNQKLARRLLEREGCVVTAAADGEEACELYERGAFDLILMDVQMPRLDGFGAVRRIRECETATGAHTPIIAMTAHAMRGDRDRCLDAGMDGYVSKPIQVAALFHAIRAATVRER
jgi:CheY-like chemotaxis protein